MARKRSRSERHPPTASVYFLVSPPRQSDNWRANGPYARAQRLRELTVLDLNFFSLMG